MGTAVSLPMESAMMHPTPPPAALMAAFAYARPLAGECSGLKERLQGVVLLYACTANRAKRQQQQGTTQANCHQLLPVDWLRCLALPWH